MEENSMTSQEVLALGYRYSGKKQNGWEVDSETGAIVVYGLNTIFHNGIYYSMQTGQPMYPHGNYIRDIRPFIGHAPIQAPGTGIVVYRKNAHDNIEVLLQLRTDLSQYGLLGGGIELGEDYETCAIRELVEEANIFTERQALKLLKVYAGPKHITKYPSGDIVFHTVVVYKLDFTDCAPVPIKGNDGETKKLTWVTLPELSALLKADNAFPNNIPILEDIVSEFFC